MKTKYTYKVIRIVSETYEVQATSAKDAIKQPMENPSNVTVVREKAIRKP